MNGAIAELLARCRTAGLALLVEGDLLHVDFESDPPVDLIEEIRQHKPEVMAALSSTPLETAEVIAPARWVSGAAGNSPEASFETPCIERRGLLERRNGSFCTSASSAGAGAPTATARLAKNLVDGIAICIGRMNSDQGKPLETDPLGEGASREPGRGGARAFLHTAAAGGEL